MESRMRNIGVTSIFILFNIFTCYAQNNKDKLNFRIQIINYDFGRVNHTTIVTPEKISSETNKARGKAKLSERMLTEKEYSKVVNFLKEFPLINLQDMYINDKVDDGTQITFIIRIKEIEKNIYVSNAFQKDLADLVALVVKLLPNDYIMYNKRYIPWKPDK